MSEHLGPSTHIRILRPIARLLVATRALASVSSVCYAYSPRSRVPFMADTSASGNVGNCPASGITCDGSFENRNALLEIEFPVIVRQGAHEDLR